MADSIEVRPVASRRDLRAFVRFPWHIYRNDRLWVPPLISDRLNYLDPKSGPFYADGEAVLLLARRAGALVGTVAAFVDRARVRHTGRPDGGFGFFEVDEEYEIARRLLDACREWLRDRSMTSVRGPTNFGDNDYPGVLIEGREYPPAMLEAHTPPYYREYLERYGMQKDHDLYAWRATFERVGRELYGESSDIVRVAEAIRKAGGITIRSIETSNWDREVATVRELFNATMSQIPDAMPLSERDFLRLSEQLRPFIDPELALIAEVDRRPVGFCLLIPDTNRVLVRLNGRLFPFKWLSVRRYIRQIDVVSFKLMGVLEEYQHRGIDALLYVDALKKANQRGYRWLDGSLTSSLNSPINLIAQGRGAERYKQYRLYRMEL